MKRKARFIAKRKAKNERLSEEQIAAKKAKFQRKKQRRLEMKEGEGDDAGGDDDA